MLGFLSAILAVDEIDGGKEKSDNYVKSNEDASGCLALAVSDV